MRATVHIRAAAQRVTRRAPAAQIMRTTVEPARHRRETSYDAYEYTAHSHTYNSFDIPSAKARCSPARHGWPYQGAREARRHHTLPKFTSRLHTPHART